MGQVEERRGLTSDEGPLLLDRGNADGERLFIELREQVRGLEVFDTIEAQLGELIRCRRPGPGLTAADVDAEAKRILGPNPERYGCWVYYPWSRRLVHVLPEGEHSELRTSRNRNKITRAEQQALARIKLGIVGLSVGQATALTLALEGIGGEMRLADYDRLSLSNMNRLRAGIHEIGVNKAVITARAIYEVNPYAKIALFTDGITDANIDGFMDGLDLLFEECDDLAMKIRLREAARARRIAVLMETSDRGMLDVERFDLEPDRPLLHGLVGNVDASSLRGLTTAEKVPFVLAIIGEISPRGAASLVDIDSTLETWPQLASAVSLGSAINADTARRIALGTFRESGRFYVDLEQIVLRSEPTVAAAAAGERREGPPSPTVRRAAAAPVPAEVATIVRWASLAPSGGNCQPWRFCYREGDDRTLECWHVPERSASMLDYDHRAAHVALG
ncbi:MAG: Rv1355c family protein, partial [Polyangiaceae bacterium]